MRVLLPALLMVLVALSGCLGDDDDGTPEPTSTGTSTQTGTSTGTSTQTGTEEPTGGPPEPVQTIEFSWAAGNGACGGPYDMWVFGTPLNGITHAEAAVDAATFGLKYQLEFEVSGALFVSIDFYDAGDALLEGGTYEFVSSGTLKGTVPDGAVNILVGDCGATSGGTATYTAG